MHFKSVALVVLALFLSACQTVPEHRLNYRVLRDDGLVAGSGNMVLLPLNVEVKEMSASGLSDVVPEWTDQAKRLIRGYLLQHAAEFIRNQHLIVLPALDEQEQARLEEHAALAKLVWADAYILTKFGGPAWAHKAKRFDYSIGPGLSEIARKTGAEKALIIIAEDVRTTSGRKALWFAMAALGVGLPLGHSVVVANVIDLNTGDLLWMNTWISVGDASLTNPEDVKTAFAELFKLYPGVDEYRKYAVGADGE